jgi:hypothetical protein
LVEKTINEIDIWMGVMNDDMSVPDANAVFGWKFSDRDKQRMEELATRNGQGTLTAPEKEELEAYMHVGQVIGILQAKARLSLKRSSGNGSG